MDSHATYEVLPIEVRRRDTATVAVCEILCSGRGEVSELAEGARLEIAYSPTRRVAGSNPALSASKTASSERAVPT